MRRTHKPSVYEHKTSAMETDVRGWHELTLEELLHLTSSRSSGGTGYIGQLSYRCDFCKLGELTPPRAGSQDDLNSYIILKWCPWFSRTFGALSESHLNTLTVQLLARDSEDTPIPLELVASVLLVLTEPNVPLAPICKEAQHARLFILSG